MPEDSYGMSLDVGTNSGGTDSGYPNSLNILNIFCRLSQLLGCHQYIIEGIRTSKSLYYVTSGSCHRTNH